MIIPAKYFFADSISRSEEIKTISNEFGWVAIIDLYFSANNGVNPRQGGHQWALHSREFINKLNYVMMIHKQMMMNCIISYLKYKPTIFPFNCSGSKETHSTSLSLLTIKSVEAKYSQGLKTAFISSNSKSSP